jgi:simple sugar transport system permease protein
MALLYLGGENAQMAANLPQSITQLFQGMVLFFLLACDVLIRYTPRLTWKWTKRAIATEAPA